LENDRKNKQNILQNTYTLENMTEEEYGQFCEIDDHSISTKYSAGRNIKLPRIYVQRRSNNIHRPTIDDEKYPSSKEKVFIMGVICSLAVVITIEYWLFG
jgi:hypothetical protein